MSATEPAPLADAEVSGAAEQFGRAFKGAVAALRRMRGRESHHRPGELSDAQYSVLFCLRDTHELSAGEIALAADLSPASTTEMLEALAQHGLVQRTRSERDRRVVLSSLTERGRELVEARHRSFAPRFRTAMGGFTAEELTTAARVLDGLRQMFDDAADEG